ncbi:TniB family NTP-binding protein [Neorhizobium tomejilense]|uniref:TniB family NTP-binding protein n=1 Tax=Neorhizobium tomejilense TaxID=2093828 RepID=UPI000CFA5F80|nr:TniB family NTP-binding protein [Neorhizobium tomejilense]
MARKTDDVAKAMRDLMPVDQQRIAEVMERVESYYIVTHNDGEAKREIDVVVRGATRRTKDGHILLVLGESHMGKSRLVEHYLDIHPSLAPISIENGNTAHPVLRLKAPADCTMAGLGREMAMQLGYRMHRSVSEDLVFQRVRAQLRVQGTKLVMIDEIQHVVDGPSIKGLRHLTDTLKNLLQEVDWPIHLILVGLPEARELIWRDVKEQAESRVFPIDLSPLNFIEHAGVVSNLIEEVLEIAGLTSAMPLTDEFIERLLHGARNRLGLVFKMLHFAIEDALDNGENEVGIEHWIDAYMRLAKRGRNVFEAEDWQTIVRGVRTDGTLLQEGEAGETRRGSKTARAAGE